MQQRWMDRPTPENDALERAIELSTTFLRRHIANILKIVPPLFGLGMFIFYFYRNHFYPSFDLFQFSSLLLAAAAIGFTIIGLLVVPLFLPGPWIFDQFLEHRIIKEKLLYSRPYLDHQLDWWVLKLGSLVFALPFLTCAVGLLLVLLLVPPLFALSVILVPILVALFFGLIIQVVFALPKFSFVRYLWAAFIGVMAVGILVAFTLGQSIPIIEGFDIGNWKWGVYLVVVVGVSGIAALCSFAFIAGWNSALHFSIFFAMVIAAYSGLLTTLPDKTVQALGLGNFQADAILLEPNYCNEPVKQLPLDKACAMKTIHVVWSLGETLVLRTDNDHIVQIPSRFVRAIIKPTEQSN